MINLISRNVFISFSFVQTLSGEWCTWAVRRTRRSTRSSSPCSLGPYSRELTNSCSRLTIRLSSSSPILFITIPPSFLASNFKVSHLSHINHSPFPILSGAVPRRAQDPSERPAGRHGHPHHRGVQEPGVHQGRVLRQQRAPRSTKQHRRDSRGRSKHSKHSKPNCTTSGKNGRRESQREERRSSTTTSTTSRSHKGG